jgi:hypothetical protein
VKHQQTRVASAIYQPNIRETGDSTHFRLRAKTVAAELLNGKLLVEPGKVRLNRTRQEVESGWRAICDILLGAGQTELASRVSRFIDQMPPVRTEREMIADGMWSHLHCPNAKDSPPTQLPQSRQ